MCRVQRQKIKLLEGGGADEQALINARARYVKTSDEYVNFSKSMGLSQQWDRVTVGGNSLEGITKPKKANSPISGIKTTSLPVKNTENHTFKGKFGVEKSDGSGIMKERGMANGMRTSPYHILTESEIETLNKDIKAIGADKSIFKFNKGTRTGYDDITDEIFVKGDVLPDLNSTHPRDLMSSRAALAHEYYGHRANRGTKLPKGAWNDEFRASYMAAKNCPNLTDEDRRYLILDALERAKEKGVTIQHNEFIRKTLYG